MRAFLQKEGLIEGSRVLCKLSNSAKGNGEIFSSVRCLATCTRESPDRSAKVCMFEMTVIGRSNNIVVPRVARSVATERGLTEGEL